MTETQFIAPRIARNKSELDKFLAARNIKSQFPPVDQQVDSIVVKNLAAGGYNPSIIQFQGQLLMTYRHHPDNKASTRLALAELDENFNVTMNQPLEINDSSPSHEDAHLYEFGGELHMCYVSSTWPSFPASSVRFVRLYKAGHWRCDSPEEHHYRERETMDKNFIPFPDGDVLRIIYRQSPRQIIYTADSAEEFVVDGPRWPYGEIRGGTTPIPYQGKLLKFFHSSLRNEMPPVAWRYYLGAMLFEPEPPFTPIAVSKRPILRGSEVGGDETRHHFKANIVFPVGAIEHEGGFLVSVGANDSKCLLCKVKELYL